jgi:hypothetical protein
VTRRGKSVSRVLYWFRTPPEIKVGREPFDAAVRQALEAQNPDIRFDWRQILETPIPSADAEKWRERRRAERSERAARQASEREDDEASGDEDQRRPDAPMHVIEAAASAGQTVVDVLTAIEPPEPSEVQLKPDAAHAPSVERSSAVDPVDVGPQVVAPTSRPRRKRRRRRGGHGRPSGPPAAGETTPPTVVAGEEDAADKDE